MKSLIKQLLLSLLLIAGFRLDAQQKASEVNGRLDEYFTSLANIGRFNGNVLITKNGRVLLQKSFNMAAIPEGMRVDGNSRFLTASASKVFVKFALIRLEQMGRIKLTDPLDKYIPGFPKGKKITLQQLLEHRSGLPRELSTTTESDDLPLDTIVNLAKSEKFVSEPGAAIHYSNLGYLLLHHVIALHSDGDYNGFMTREVFAHLGLSNTGLYKKGTPSLVQGYVPSGNGPAASVSEVLRESYNNDYYTTVQDLHLFSQKITDAKTIDRRLALKMFWKDSILAQSGGREGYRSYFYQNLKTSITFIFLGNYSDMPFQEVCEDAIKIVQGQPYRLKTKELRAKKEITQDKLKQYAGRYVLEMDANQFFDLSIEKDGLIFFDGVERIRLIHEGNDTFFEKPESTDSFIFEENEKTKKFDLLIVTNGVRFKARRVD